MNKAELRKHYLAERKKLSEEAVRQMSQEISSRFADWIANYAQWALIRSVHCFLPIRKQKEIDTYFIIDHLRHQYPDIPVVLSKISPDNHSTEHFIWNETTELAENAWGILEPKTGDLFPNDQIDLVLVPLLVFDQSGHRVGYGKGYYDRFMAECRPETIKIGLSIFPPIASISDASHWDVQLNYCITPEKVWKFAKPTIV